MFIQIKDIDNNVDTKDSGVFILHTRSNTPIYISRSFAGHNILKYTSSERNDALVYFNRQAAVDAISTAFRYTNLILDIERIPINGESKESAKRKDTIRKMAKNEARRNRGNHQ